MQTTAYLVEDGARLLIAFDARDPDPGSIRAYLRDRDTAYYDDFVGIVIDSFGDQRYGYEFFVNALGVQMDLSQDDVNGNENDNWDAIWDSAGRIDADGFAVEMAIPLSQLRFARTDGERVWGIDLLRFRPRTARTRISNNPLDRGSNCYLCQFERIRGLAGVEPSRNLEIVPSLTTGRTDRQPDPLVDSLEAGDSETEVGLNVRWAMTQDLTANLALNPDFSQVEADVPQLDINSQFALPYPESRPFFLEGADYFVDADAGGLHAHGCGSRRRRETHGPGQRQHDSASLPRRTRSRTCCSPGRCRRRRSRSTSRTTHSSAATCAASATRSSAL